METVIWEEIENNAKQIFNIWIDQPELNWAKMAWEIIIKEKLADYNNTLEYYSVVFRLFSLGQIYSEFCCVAWEECFEPTINDWADPFEFDPFILGQYYASLPQWEFDDYAEMEEVYKAILAHEREAVIGKLIKGFGGTHGFYKSMLNSRISNEKRCDVDEDDGDEDEDFEYDSQAAYEWVDQGCPSTSY